MRECSPIPCCCRSSGGGGGRSAMSSIVPTDSILEEGMRWEEVSEPWRDTDFLFKVRLRSSRKRGFSARELGPADFGEVRRTGEE